MGTVAFLISYDEERYLEECVYYIKRLQAPAGIQVEIAGVRDVSGEEGALLEAVRENQAEYKVCLDQRMFLVDDHFLYKMLEFFWRNPKVGAAGILGGGSLEGTEQGRLLLWDENGIGEFHVWREEGKDGSVQEARSVPEGVEARGEEGQGAVLERGEEEAGSVPEGVEARGEEEQGAVLERGAERRGNVPESVGAGGKERAGGVSESVEARGEGAEAEGGQGPGNAPEGKRGAQGLYAQVDHLSSMLLMTRCDTVDCAAIKEYGYELAVPYQSASMCLYDCRENGTQGPWAEYSFWLLRVEMSHDLECAGKVRQMLLEGRLPYKEHRRNVERQAFTKVITGYFWEDFLFGKKPGRYLAPDGAVPVMGGAKLHVAMAFNHGYVVYAAVMLQSLYENNKLCAIYVHILQCELSEMDKSLLQGQAREFGNEVLFYDCRKEWLPEGCLVTQEWSLEAYFRLFMADVLPEWVDRVLYLDVDVIVNRPLYEFYFMDMQEKDIVACRDFSLVMKEGFTDKRKELFAKQEGKDFVYFNSGVMLVDMGRLRDKARGADYLEVAKELQGRLLAPDQDILNMVHWEHVGLVDEFRYDLFQGCLKDLTPEEVRQQASIIHYAGPKPWQVSDVTLHAHRVWWEYAGRVGFLQRNFSGA